MSGPTVICSLGQRWDFERRVPQRRIGNTIVSQLNDKRVPPRFNGNGDGILLPPHGKATTKGDRPRLAWGNESREQPLVRLFTSILTYICPFLIDLKISETIGPIQLDCRSGIHTRTINLSANRKGYGTFETTVGQLSARRIHIFLVPFSVIIF